MSEEVSALDDIRKHVSELRTSVSQSIEENSVLNEKIKSLSSEKSELLAINNELKEQIKMLKLAKQLDGEKLEENKDVKLMINEMVREIDKCIGLLNK
jgi:predicted RNase H-like nuclease (RuvC/YqgF family)